MTGKVVGIRERFSENHQKNYFQIFIQTEDNTHRQTYVDQSNRNFKQ